MLPHKDGFSISQEIKKVDPKVPIIFLTAKTQTEDVVKGFKSGGNDYIRKPFSMEELIARIENLIRLKSDHSGANKLQDPIIQLGAYTFDFRKYELRLEDKIKK